MSIVLSCLLFTPLGRNYPGCASGNALTNTAHVFSLSWNFFLSECTISQCRLVRHDIQSTSSYDAGLHSQLHTLSLANLFLVWLQSGLHPFSHELLHLLRRTSDKPLGLQQVVQNPPYRLEVWVLSNPLDKVVLATLPLDHPRGLVGEDLDALVRLLPVTDSARVGTRGCLCDECHNDILGCHEGQLLRDAHGDDLWVHDEAFADVLKGAHYDVCGEKRLGKGDPTVCTGTTAGRENE